MAQMELSAGITSPIKSILKVSTKKNGRQIPPSTIGKIVRVLAVSVFIVLIITVKSNAL